VGKGRRESRREEKLRKRRRKIKKQRKVEQGRLKVIDIWTEWKREIGNNKLNKK
jgi:hypothetical protein